MRLRLRLRSVAESKAMSKQWLVRFVLVPGACVVLAGCIFGQQNQQDITGALEETRADMRADKVEIVKNAMNLNPQQADKFWPVYRDYEYEVQKLNDRRIKLVKFYAEKMNNMTDKDAKELAQKFFDLENDRTDLRRNYFDTFRKATDAVTAAKFFQVEHRLDLLVDLQIASAIPGLYQGKETSAGK
jgi:hypothetical protein